MTEANKVELLYKFAHGKSMSRQEAAELRKYKVAMDDGDYATKANIRAYVKAVDKGCLQSFYDWCLENNMGDRRRKGHSEDEMAKDKVNMNLGSAVLGSFSWSILLSSIGDPGESYVVYLILGAIISFALCKFSKRWAAFTCFLLPIILVAVIAS